MLTAILITVAVLVVGDASYSSITSARCRAWENGQARDADGLLPGFAPFTVGEGKTALVMVHGFGSSPAVFTKMAARLGDEGFTCRAVRLPGFGETVEASANSTWEDWAAHVERECEALRATHDRVWLVGHSLGGALSYRLALERTNLVDGVVLIAPLVDVRSKRSLGIPPRAIFQVADHVLIFSDVFESVFPVDLQDKTLVGVEARQRFVPREVYREMFRLIDGMRASTAMPPVPVYVEVAAEDLVVDPDAATRFFGPRVAEPDALHVVADAGHVLPLDGGWEDLTARVAAFVRKHESDT